MNIDALSATSLVQFPNSKQEMMPKKENFAHLVEKFIADVNGDLLAARQAQKQLMDGDVQNMVEIMATIEKADISLRFLTEVRNKALEAYQEIMRMQV